MTSNIHCEPSSVSSLLDYCRGSLHLLNREELTHLFKTLQSRRYALNKAGEPFTSIISNKDIDQMLEISERRLSALEYYAAEHERKHPFKQYEPNPDQHLDELN